MNSALANPARIALNTFVCKILCVFRNLLRTFVKKEAWQLYVITLCLNFPFTALCAIPSAYHQVATKFKIPETLLYAVAQTESGMTLRTKYSKRFRPWPWTLNVAGTPRRYSTRLAAFKALNFYLNQGIRSIDIGLMQVNWRFHRQKLGSSWQSLDPYHNLRTGAQILKTAYRECQQWRKAVGRYHSPGNTAAQRKRAKRYTARVFSKLQRLPSATNAL